MAQSIFEQHDILDQLFVELQRSYKLGRMPSLEQLQQIAPHLTYAEYELLMERFSAYTHEQELQQFKAQVEQLKQQMPLLPDHTPLSTDILALEQEFMKSMGRFLLNREQEIGKAASAKMQDVLQQNNTLQGQVASLQQQIVSLQHDLAVKEQQYQKLHDAYNMQQSVVLQMSVSEEALSLLRSILSTKEQRLWQALAPVDAQGKTIESTAFHDLSLMVSLLPAITRENILKLLVLAVDLAQERVATSQAPAEVASAPNAVPAAASSTSQTVEPAASVAAPAPVEAPEPEVGAPVEPEQTAPSPAAAAMASLGAGDVNLQNFAALHAALAQTQSDLGDDEEGEQLTPEEWAAAQALLQGTAPAPVAPAATAPASLANSLAVAASAATAITATPSPSPSSSLTPASTATTTSVPTTAPAVASAAAITPNTAISITPPTATQPASSATTAYESPAISIARTLSTVTHGSTSIQKNGVNLNMGPSASLSPVTPVVGTTTTASSNTAISSSSSPASVPATQATPAVSPEQAQQVWDGLEHICEQLFADKEGTDITSLDLENAVSEALATGIFVPAQTDLCRRLMLKMMICGREQMAVSDFTARDEDILAAIKDEEQKQLARAMLSWGAAHSVSKKSGSDEPMAKLSDRTNITVSVPTTVKPVQPVRPETGPSENTAITGTAALQGAERAVVVSPRSVSSEPSSATAQATATPKPTIDLASLEAARQQQVAPQEPTSAPVIADKTPVAVLNAQSPRALPRDESTLVREMSQGLGDDSIAAFAAASAKIESLASLLNSAQGAAAAAMSASPAASVAPAAISATTGTTQPKERTGAGAGVGSGETGPQVSANAQGAVILTGNTTIAAQTSGHASGGQLPPAVQAAVQQASQAATHEIASVAKDVLKVAQELDSFVDKEQEVKRSSLFAPQSPFGANTTGTTVFGVQDLKEREKVKLQAAAEKEREALVEAAAQEQARKEVTSASAAELSIDDVITGPGNADDDLGDFITGNISDPNAELLKQEQHGAQAVVASKPLTQGLESAAAVTAPVSGATLAAITDAESAALEKAAVVATGVEAELNELHSALQNIEAVLQQKKQQQDMAQQGTEQTESETALDASAVVSAPEATADTNATATETAPVPEAAPVSETAATNAGSSPRLGTEVAKESLPQATSTAVEAQPQGEHATSDMAVPTAEAGAHTPDSDKTSEVSAPAAKTAPAEIATTEATVPVAESSADEVGTETTAELRASVEATTEIAAPTVAVEASADAEVQSQAESSTSEMAAPVAETETMAPAASVDTTSEVEVKASEATTTEDTSAGVKVEALAQTDQATLEIAAPLAESTSDATTAAETAAETKLETEEAALQEEIANSSKYRARRALTAKDRTVFTEVSAELANRFNSRLNHLNKLLNGANSTPDPDSIVYVGDLEGYYQDLITEWSQKEHLSAAIKDALKEKMAADVATEHLVNISAEDFKLYPEAPHEKAAFTFIEEPAESEAEAEDEGDTASNVTFELEHDDEESRAAETTADTELLDSAESESSESSAGDESQAAEGQTDSANAEKESSTADVADATTTTTTTTTEGSESGAVTTAQDAAAANSAATEAPSAPVAETTVPDKDTANSQPVQGDADAAAADTAAAITDNAAESTAKETVDTAVKSTTVETATASDTVARAEPTDTEASAAHTIESSAESEAASTADSAEDTAVTSEPATVEIAATPSAPLSVKAAMEALVGMPAANEVSTSASPSSGTQTPADADAGTPAYMRLNSVLDAFRAAARSGESQEANTNGSGSATEEKTHSPSLSSVFASVVTPESNGDEARAEADAPADSAADSAVAVDTKEQGEATTEATLEAETNEKQVPVSGESTEVAEEPTAEAANTTTEAETDQSGEATSETALEAETTAEQDSVDGEATDVAEEPTAEAANTTAEAEPAQSGEATSEAALEAETTTSEQDTVNGESTKVAEEPTAEAANTTTEAETDQSGEATSSDASESTSAAAASGESPFTVTAAVSTEQATSGSESPSIESNTAHGNAFLVEGSASGDSDNDLRLSADKQEVNTAASLSVSSFTDTTENSANSSMLDQAQELHTVGGDEEPAEDSSTADSEYATATETAPETSVASITDSEQSTADAEDVTAESSAEPLEVISAKEYHTQKQNEIHGVWRSDNPNSAYSSHLTEADNHGFNGGKTQGQGLGTMYNAPKSATFMFHEAQDRSEEIREAKRRHDSEQHAFAIDQHVFAGTNSYRQMGAVTVGTDSKDTVKPEEQREQPKEDAAKSAYASGSKIQWLSHDSE